MEVAMINNSELIVLFLMLPVFMQIIVPLLMLLGWGFVCVMRAVLGRKKIVDDMQDDSIVSEGLQFSKS
jgi:hypothetical protein